MITKLLRIYLTVFWHQCVPPSLFNITKHAVFAAWKCIPIDFYTTKHGYLLVDHQCNPHPCSISQKMMYFTPWKFTLKSSLNRKSYICPLFSINTTPISVQYQKTRCILLPGNVFQFIPKMPSIDLPLVGHQCTPIPVQ